MTGTLRFTPQGRPSWAAHLVESVSTPRTQTGLLQHHRSLVYRLNPWSQYFYEQNQYTVFDQQERLKLGGSPLVKWLYLWIIGNAEQYPHKVETIRTKCGSRDTSLKSFRQKLRRALDELKAAGVITAWHIDEADLVHIERTPSAVQLRHLANTSTRSATKEQPTDSPPAAPASRRHLKPNTVEAFRAQWGRLAPYACQADFDAWLADKKPPENYDRAFLGFAAKWVKGKL